MLEGQCKTSNVVYQAKVKTNNKCETYVGLTSTEFKTRYRNHKASFNDRNKRNSTELSKYIWELKDRNEEYGIKWKVLHHAQPYNNVSKRCNLCLAEKHVIICNPDLATLNKRSELVSGCRHKAKHLVGTVT